MQFRHGGQSCTETIITSIWKGNTMKQDMLNSKIHLISQAPITYYSRLIVNTQDTWYSQLYRTWLHQKPVYSDWPWNSPLVQMNSIAIVNMQVSLYVNVCKYSAMLHEASFRSAHAGSVLNGITQSYLPPTRLIPARAESHMVIEKWV